MTAGSVQTPLLFKRQAKLDTNGRVLADALDSLSATSYQDAETHTTHTLVTKKIFIQYSDKILFVISSKGLQLMTDGFKRKAGLFFGVFFNYFYVPGFNVTNNADDGGILYNRCLSTVDPV